LIVILGWGPLGDALARELSVKGERTLYIVPEGVSARIRRARHVEVLRAPRSRWAGLVPEEAGAAFVVLGGAGNGKRLVSALRKARPDMLLLAEADPTDASDGLRAAGADFVLESKRFLASAMLDQITELESERAARRLVAAIRPCKKRGLGIFLHDDPDPDTLSSGMALMRICAALDVRCTIYFGGDISRPDNRLMASLLGRRLRRLSSPADAEEAMARHDKTALVESSFPGRNNILPPGATVDIILDHHPLLPGDQPAAAMCDIRPGLGAVATLMTGYMRRLWIRPDPSLAAALLYAIKVDTQDLTRNVGPEDLAATVYLAEHADLRLLGRFESPPMTGATAEVLARAVMDRELLGGHLLAFAGGIRDREAIAQAAELLMRLEGVSVAVVFGIMRDKVYVSARSAEPSVDAGRLLHSAFGRVGSAGGHATAAGAQIPLASIGIGDDRGRLKLARNAVRKLYFRAAGLPERGDGRL
jgi:nanoRNase/pAp phosphatase (c-di-AMP/oligoRNAs hydrolase)